MIMIARDPQSGLGHFLLNLAKSVCDVISHIKVTVILSCNLVQYYIR